MTAKSINEPSESTTAISTAPEIYEQLGLLIVDLAELLAPKDAEQLLVFQNSAQQFLQNVPPEQWLRKEVLQAISEIHVAHQP